MILPSTSSNSSQSSIDSPISPHQNVTSYSWFPPIPRRRVEIPKYPRFYSTPLNQDLPDSTPLQIYGLEEREPSIAEKPRRFVRFSRALDDIKEDFTQPQARDGADAIRARRQSTFSSFFFDNGSMPTLSENASMHSGVASGSGFSRASSVSAGHGSGANSPEFEKPPVPPIPEDVSMKPLRRLSRRLSTLSFSQRKARYRGGNASISQPNLIGSSNQI
ncbi:hypothetical protein BJY01DRAFT_243443 [Aspergillus pseudoustus]|uniref:Uncharacterized protein n=1 Tax=Aspergillus pseudoustus TaxID=1810923 RepID=A0ABR4KRT5_9EURO